jgi:Na+-translocating ferredoxin:NAD+ oxidoreductase subunit E
MSDAQEGFVPNPVLSGLIGLCPLVAAARSLAEGIVYGLGAAFCALVLGELVPLLKDQLADRLKAPATLCLSAFIALCYAFALRMYSPTIAAGLWIYLPLLAVSGLSLSVLRRTSSKGRFGPDGRSRFVDIAVESLLFALTAALVGGLREIIGLGTLTLPAPGLSLARVELMDFPPLRLLVSPAGGFIFLGFAAALYRSIVRRTGRRSA